MKNVKKSKQPIGVLGALSIGVGGIVGGGFFATFGLTIEGARGGTPVAFLIAGAIALATAYSYIGLTLRYPGPGGTNAFLRIAYGRGLLPASMSVLLVLSYVAIMSVHASAIRLRHETGTSLVLPAIAFLLCVAALVIMVAQFLSSPSTLSSAMAIVAIVVLSVVIEIVFRAIHGSPTGPDQG